MSASWNEKYALKHASPSRVESVRRALDDCHDSTGQRPAPAAVSFHCIREVCSHSPYYEVPHVYNPLLAQ